MRPSRDPVLRVRVVDRSGPDWPVHAAAFLWRTSHVQLVPALSCGGPDPCVVVSEGRFGRNGWTGRTVASRGLMSSFQSPVAIYLNDSYRLARPVRLAVACHELGHALGLGHNNSATSCLHASAGFARPAPADLSALELLYRLPG